MGKKNSLRSQLERATYDKSWIHKNVIIWKKSMEEVLAVLQSDRRKK